MLASDFSPVRLSPVGCGETGLITPLTCIHTGQSFRVLLTPLASIHAGHCIISVALLSNKMQCIASSSSAQTRLQPTPHMMFLFISSQFPFVGPTVGVSAIPAVPGLHGAFGPPNQASRQALAIR